MDVDHRLLFAFMGTGSDPYRPRRRHMLVEGLQHVGGIRRMDVEFQIAQCLHLRGQCAQLDETRCIGLRLRRDTGNRAQRAPDQRLEHAIALQRTRRQPSVEDVHRNATIAATEQHVRPQLGLQDQRQTGLEVPKKTADAARHVVRQIDMVHVIAPQRAHPLRAGRGDGGDDPADVRALCTQCIDQRCSRIDLAHRHRMQPYTWLCAAVRIGRIALVPAPEVLAHAETAPYQVVHGDGQQQIEHGRIDAAQQKLDGILAHRRRIRENAATTRQSAVPLHNRRHRTGPDAAAFAAAVPFTCNLACSARQDRGRWASLLAAGLDAAAAFTLRPPLRAAQGRIEEG